MQYSKRIARVGLSLLAAALLPGCPTPTMEDAGDVTASDASDLVSDVRNDTVVDTGIVDTGIVDTGTVEAGDDVVDVTADDVTDTMTVDAADVPVDSGACGPTPDPMHYYEFHPTALIMRLDGTQVGAPAINTNVFSVERPGPVATPDDMAGNCVYFNAGLTGSPTRNAAANYDLGPITARQTSTSGNTLISLTYDTTRMQYTSDTTMANPLLPNTQMDLTVTGNLTATPSQAPGMASLVFPPNLLPANITGPTGMWSRTADNEVLFDVPAEAGSDTVAVFWIFSMMRDHVIVCAAPACEGRVVVPGQMINHYASGTQFNWFLWMGRHTVVPPADRMDQQLEYTVLNGSWFYGIAE